MPLVASDAGAVTAAGRRSVNAVPEKATAATPERTDGYETSLPYERPPPDGGAAVEAHRRRGLRKQGLQMGTNGRDHQPCVASGSR